MLRGSDGSERADTPVTNGTNGTPGGNRPLSSVGACSDTRFVKSWIGIVALFAGAILVALLLKVTPPLVVFVALAGIAAVVVVRLRARVRREGTISQASVLGLRAVDGDPFGLRGLGFTLFERGTDAGVESVLSGIWRGLEVKQFTVTCAFEGQTDARRRFACATAPTGLICPPLVAEPETFITQKGGAAPMARVTFDPQRFGRRFSVWCDDEAFARALVDERMMAWLPELGDDWGFEMCGASALVYGTQLHRPDALSVLQILGDLLARVPDPVRMAFAPEAVGPDAPERETAPGPG